MRKVARRAARVACLAGGVCLLAGCVALSQYDRGREAAKAEASNARKDFGPAAEPMVVSRILAPGHAGAEKPPEWRKGYLEGMREEFRDFPTPPHWGGAGE
jgi:hypothetical protein